MNLRPDPRVIFEPELSLQPLSIEPQRRRWLPMPPTQPPALDTRHWLTRASRGLSWHRRGICR